MNGTPRLRSSYPSTPGSGQSNNPQDAAPKVPRVRTSLQNLPDSVAAATVSSNPVIPVNLIDAPTQRLCTLAIYGLLFAWRLFDWWTLVEEDTKSISYFFKWCMTDLAYMFGVPLLRIPWLEWSDTASFLATISHAVINMMLMFRIPLPIEGWLLVLVKTFFDRELSISENSVRPASILQNSSLIMGKQIINILPEGSVTMNPDHIPFCLDSRTPSVHIPLYFNQTVPKHVELLRIDLETNVNETITLTKKEVNSVRKIHEDGIVTLNYVTKKPGLYRLYKVVDRSKLEVQRRMSDTIVVLCPKAVVKSTAADKCLGDLSDLRIDIEGTPPLKIVYSRTSNRDTSVHHFQSIQPENFASPLVGSNSGIVVGAGSADVSWARQQHITVPLNESMTPGGKWLYSIDQIHDGLGNVRNYSSGSDDGEHTYPRGTNLEQAFTVHERPSIRMEGCDSRSPLKIGKGRSERLPIKYDSHASSGRIPDDTSYTLTWRFSPLDTLTKNGDHGEVGTIAEHSATSAFSDLVVREPGLYTLVGVKSKYCDGQIEEPASCLLLNPPEPELTISAENINDKCAGNSIGLLVDLDLVGTPPFVVTYDIITKSGIKTESVNIAGLRHQLELKPRDAGHFKYHFKSVDDEVYRGHALGGSNLVLEQDVRPPASARLRRPSGSIEACIEEPVEMNVELFGENPFTLEYELVHEGKRKKSKIANIETDTVAIKTDPLLKGGEYSLALTSVQDKTGCKIFLNGETKFTVRRQRPQVSFGKLEGKYTTTEVDGRKISLPLRLTGSAPWTVKYRNLNDKSIIQKTARSFNDMIKVDKEGTYELLEVSDGHCPGTVDSTANTFEVGWFARPHIKIADTAVLIPNGNKYVKREVCEGDIDAVEVNLIGSAPYSVKYDVMHKPKQGSKTTSSRGFEAAMGQATISMDTSKPGTYEYKFSELSDGLYDHDSKKFTPLIIEQKVNSKPSAHFVKPGQSYKYCKEELAGDEIIPIRLEGVPPFSLEVDIKHQSNSRPETVKIANIEGNTYSFRIPHRVLSLGVHQVSVRKVRDSHGCQQKTEYGAPHVQVQVYDVPTINPLESRTDYCVGERIAYTLSGTAPFEIFYTFEGVQKKAKSQSTTFRRIAERAGNFIITGVADKASECKASTEISKIVHEMPSVKISKGRQLEVDIHEGGEAEILFEFWGTPPFEFTYTRSTNARRGQKSQVLETRHETSYEHSKSIQSSQEGTYEVVAIKDKFCSFSTQKAEDHKQKLLQF